MSDGYRRALTVVLRHQPLTLRDLRRHAGDHRRAVRLHPQGLLPAAGHGLHRRDRRGRAGHLVRGDERALEHDRRHRAPGSGGHERRLHARRQHLQQQPISSSRLKPKEDGRKVTRRRGDRAAAARSSPASKAPICYLQAAQDINVGGRLARTQYQYTLTDADIDELGAWAPRILDRLRELPQLTDVVSDQQTERRRGQPDDRPRPRVELRHHAGDDRRHDLRRHRPAPGRAVLHPAQHLPRDPRGDCRSCRRIRACSITST